MTVTLTLPGSVAAHLSKTTAHPTLLEALRTAPRFTYGRGQRLRLEVDTALGRALEQVMRQHVRDIGAGDLTAAHTGLRPTALYRALATVRRQMAAQGAAVETDDGGGQ